MLIEMAISMVKEHISTTEVLTGVRYVWIPVLVVYMLNHYVYPGTHARSGVKQLVLSVCLSSVCLSSEKN